MSYQSSKKILKVMHNNQLGIHCTCGKMYRKLGPSTILIAMFKSNISLCQLTLVWLYKIE